jgi:hypothetical protein
MNGYAAQPNAKRRKRWLDKTEWISFNAAQCGRAQTLLVIKEALPN